MCGNIQFSIPILPSVVLWISVVSLLRPGLSEETEDTRPSHSPLSLPPATGKEDVRGAAAPPGHRTDQTEHCRPGPQPPRQRRPEMGHLSGGIIAECGIVLIFPGCQ